MACNMTSSHGSRPRAPWESPALQRSSRQNLGPFGQKMGCFGAADALLACKCFKGGQSYWMGVASSFRTSSLAIKYGKSGYMKLIRQDDLRFFFSDYLRSAKC
jgi:hypothetical protein